LHFANPLDATFTRRTRHPLTVAPAGAMSCV
jgi:hypothetical protein